MIPTGIIGGTGMAQLAGLEIEREERAVTPWGEPSAPLVRGRYAGMPVVFLARHGRDHDIAPHAINYRANVWALRDAGVRRVIAVNAVGGISADCAPGTLVVPDQLIDYSWGRAHSYCDGTAMPLEHVDFTAPYSDTVREWLLWAGAAAGIEPRDGGTYAATQGPRLETAAEIDRLERDGCDIVGMTGMPEAALARELKLEYACCAVVVNWAAGRGGDIHTELEAWVQTGMAAARRLIEAALGAGATS
ncbi:S-methyl-5'-thioinosine phosphorylase [Thioalkalivibrio sp. XN279]|uniref:S-methyl-5'-thioinosine phosphorylase n=1 Tax=Thioalkalivibrio sp. XN279 TaxID=2714953 RepID=UPI00140C5EEF|nr:S-methyl-5'-thioinosine phosphorylase [Thioalkalivibrio sp. XN279]NHA15242.1 S-methyl-5'-thioinosine phosphorylase [Thioalkalivibrio sp. XN279]